MRPNDGARDDQICAQTVGLIDRYLARSIAVPLLGSLVLAAMLLVLDKMLRLFQYVVDAGGPVSVVWRMLANLLPEYLSLGIPIGLMLGILLAFRKLALSSELDALRGIGIGYGRLLRVPYAYAIPLMILNLFIVGYLEPYTHYRYEGLRFDLKSGALGAAIKVGEFNRLGKQPDAAHRPQREQGHPAPRHLRPDATTATGMTVAATAEHGRFLSTDDPDTILFRLTKGRLVQDSPKFATPRTLVVRHLRSADQPAGDRPVPPPRRHRVRRALPARAVARRLWRRAPDRRAEARRPRPTLNFRLVEVVMMLMLPLLAVALAVPPKRSSSALGIFLVDPDRRRLSQGQSICRAGGAQRADRSDARLVGAARRCSRR